MNTIRIPTPAELSALTTKDIERVYSGKQGCMCGCLGNYYGHTDGASGKRMMTKVLKEIVTSPRARVQDGKILFLAGREGRNYVVYLNEDGKRLNAGKTTRDE